MSARDGSIRLFVESDLKSGQGILLSHDHAHYLANVMRRKTGDRVAVFNGRDGAWRAEVSQLGKKSGMLVPLLQIAPQRIPPDLWLLFSPIKKARTDFIVEKATELGCARIQPVFTQRTNNERLKVERLQAHAIEAAEQCGETYVPTVSSPVRLAAALQSWTAERRLIFCDETRDAETIQDTLKSAEPGPWAILTGPEGGFTPEEAGELRGLPFVSPVSLGPRVLRADTAAVAAVSLWQSWLGDWR
ncbi:MAG: 16S rRNA (uracil(1498)-N(3))-methyltransferase [Pseudomonadota bacterium]